MNLHLTRISRHVTPGAHAVVLLDCAGWHQLGGVLRLPYNISLLYLQPYSPELNQVEQHLAVSQFRRQNFLSNHVYDGYDAIVDACCAAWNALIASPERIRSITHRSWAVVVREQSGDACFVRCFADD